MRWWLVTQYIRNVCRVQLVYMFLLFCMMTVLRTANAKQYNVINYRREQGFAATIAYSIYQDSKGYLWIGSENGLMRFNGRDFKIYTTRDGLPDNEILQITEDKQGRLWLLPFANAICYMQYGVIHHAGNDALLKSLHFKERPIGMRIDRDQNMWVYSAYTLIRIGIDHKTEEFKRSDIDIGPHSSSAIFAAWTGASGVLTVALDDKIYRWNGRKFIHAGIAPFPVVDGLPVVFGDRSVLYQLEQGRYLFYKDSAGTLLFGGIRHTMPAAYVSGMSRASSGELLLGTDNGGLIIDLNTGVCTDSFLTGIKVGAIIETKDGSFWLGTVGHGFFKIQQTPVRSLETERMDQPVYFIAGTKEGMYCTTEKTSYIEALWSEASGTYKTTTTNVTSDRSAYDRYLFAGKNRQGDYIFCAYKITLKRQLDKPGIRQSSGFCKAVIREDSTFLLMATNLGILRFDQERFCAVDTFLFQTRTVGVAKIGTVIYAGTLNGLMACYPGGKSVAVLGDTSLLQGHIMALCTGNDSMLWVANNRAELVGIRHNKIVAVLNLDDGLQCNNISAIKASGSMIWIGTDNGLYAVSQQPPYEIVRHLTYATGLNSNQINCLDVYGKRVWVGTVRGVNYFDEDDVVRIKDNSSMVVNSIMNDKTRLRASREVLLLEGKTLSVDFDVIDFTGSATPIFQYRLNDKDEWTALDGNLLYFPSLPYGKFTLTIRALSPTWSQGVFFRQTFLNPGPFYKSWWFVSLTSLVLIAGIALTAFLIVRRVRKKDAEKMAVQQNLLQLEQMALQAQMNPHFIFNCMAAVKHLYSTGDNERADAFVDEFALLIRQTFEMGEENFITWNQERSYLERYLHVERGRFDHSFNFTIEEDIQLPGNYIPVPVMLLQPIVENAIRHGIRHLPDGTGNITVVIRQEGSQVVFEITDNGIGLRKSLELKGLDAHSRTSSIVNNKRIRILNQLFAGQITMKTEDLSERGNHSTGTRVVISYPVTIHPNNQT